LSTNELRKWFVELTKKWSEIWEKNRVYEADPDKTRPKVYITAAFMYPNGPMHIGHARTYLIADIVARFSRLLGYNVLFPMGFHYTGTPILTMAESIASGDETLIKIMKEDYEVPEEALKKMVDPLYLARYFHEISKETMKLFGLSIDWRREFTTVDKEFQSFIHWQFRKLHSKGFIVQGSHPVGWCPKHSMPVGMHDTKGDVEPEIGDFVVLFFEAQDGTIYPAATLRPETVYGVTNLWVNPDEQYVRIELADGMHWIVGAKAAERLRHQLDFKVLEYIEGKNLVGIWVRNPATGEEVPVLPAGFVDAGHATGVVMSVPAHAPYDMAALIDLKRGAYREIIERAKLQNFIEAVSPRKIIESPTYPGIPVLEAIERAGVSSQRDKEKLERLTNEIYSEEFTRGHMTPNLAEFVVVKDGQLVTIARELSSKPVKDAREKISEALVSLGKATIIYEILNRPVYCRCGTEIVVKLLRGQWFIDYGNPAWKKLALEALNNIKIIPEEARKQFIDTINWLQRKACARSRGLGVPLPWDKSWIIESLSDSTIYMAFYTVIHKIRQSIKGVDTIDDDFWDYVLLGMGNTSEIAKKLGISTEELESIREEFDYWYPLDWRCSGKDLIPNHLTFFIFNHAAIFPKEKWPRGIIANGWVLVRSKKMSKSERNIIPLFKLIRIYGSDPIRLSLVLGAEVEQDLDFNPDQVDTYISQLKSIYDFIVEAYRKYSQKPSYELTYIDRVYLSTFAATVNEIIEKLKNIRIRDAAVTLFSEALNIVREYLSLGEVNSSVLLTMLRTFVKLMYPFTPFIAEEIWSQTFGGEMLAKTTLEKIPEPSTTELFAYKYVKLIKSSIDEIAKALKKEKVEKVVIYVAPAEQQKLMKKLIDLTKTGAKLPEIMRRLLSESAPADKGEFAQTIRALYEVLTTSPEDIRKLYAYIDDEFDILAKSRELIEALAGCPVTILRSDDPNVPDLGGKKRAARPLRPGIYIA